MPPENEMGFFVRYRKVALGLLILVAVVVATQLGELRAEFHPDDLLSLESDDAHAAFGRRDPPLVVVVEAPDVLDAPTLDYVHRLARRFSSLPWVARADGLTTVALPHVMTVDDPEVTLDTLDEGGAEEHGDGLIDLRLAAVIQSAPERFPLGLLSLAGPLEVSPLVTGDTVSPQEAARVRQAIEDLPLLRRQLIDDHGTVTLLSIVMRPALARVDAREAMAEARAILASEPSPQDARASLAGLPLVEVTVVEALLGEHLWLIALSTLGSAFVLLLAFRRASSAAVPMAIVGLSLVLFSGALAVLGEPVDLLTNVIPPLIVTIGLGDAVHILSRYRDELAEGGSRLAAATRTMKAMAGACLLTSLTTAIGFISLALTATASIRRFGLLAAVAVMAVYLITLIAFAALLATMRPPPGGGSSDAWAGRLAVWATRHRTALLLGSLAVFGGALGFGSRAPIDGALLDPLPRDSEVVMSAALVDGRLDGIRRLEVFVEPRDGVLGAAELSAVARLTDALRADPSVRRVTSYTDWLGAGWSLLTGDPGGTPVLASDGRVAAVHGLLVQDAPHRLDDYRRGDALRVDIGLADAGLSAMQAHMGRIEQAIAAEPLLTGTLGGEAHRTTRGLHRLVEELLLGFGLAIVAIFAAIAIFVRSPRLSILSIPPNVIPLAVALAYLHLRGWSLDATTAIVFSVTLGLVVDGTVHVLFRFSEECRRGRPLPEAVRRAMETSGRAVVVGSATLLIGFVVLRFSTFVPIQRFAELSIVGVVSALACELLVVPALLASPLGARAALSLRRRALRTTQAPTPIPEVIHDAVPR